MGSIVDAEHTDTSDGSTVIAGTRTESVSKRAKLTAFKGFICMGMYEILDEPQQIYSIDDARDVRPFLTAHTWSLEKIFCRPRNSRYIAIVRGPGALTRGQIKSSVACTILGSFLVFLLMVSLLTYLQAGAVGTIFLCIIAFFIALPNFKSTFRLLKLAKDLIVVRTDMKEEAARGSKSERSVNFSQREDTVMAATESEGLYITVMRYRVTRPTRTFASILFGLEFFFFFFWPLAALFAIGNWPLGGLYFITAFITGLRYYMNAAVVLEETGHMDLVDGKSAREVWRNKSRLDDIVGNISKSIQTHRLPPSLIVAHPHANPNLLQRGVAVDVSGLPSWDSLDSFSWLSSPVRSAQAKRIQPLEPMSLSPIWTTLSTSSWMLSSTQPAL
jgi:hypothetical protein